MLTGKEIKNIFDLQKTGKQIKVKKGKKMKIMNGNKFMYNGKPQR